MVAETDSLAAPNGSKQMQQEFSRLEDMLVMVVVVVFFNSINDHGDQDIIMNTEISFACRYFLFSKPRQDV
jgi:hypothetical protein